MQKHYNQVDIDDYSAVVLGGSESLKNYSLYHLLIAEQIQYYKYYDSELDNVPARKMNRKFQSFMKGCFSCTNMNKK